MLSAFLALAWLVWGAGTADAAPAGPGSGPGAVPIKEVPLPVAPPAQTAAALARTAVAVLNQAPAAVATVADTAAPVLTETAPVLTAAAPVLNPAADVIDQASGVLPVSLPVPPVVPPRVPLAPTTGNEARPATAPATAPATPPDAALPKQAAAGLGQRTAGPGDTAAQLPVDAAAVRALPAADEYLAPSSPPAAPQDPEKLPWLSALQGPAGSSSSGPGAGPGGGGAQAAGDAAGFWNPLAASRSAPVPDMAHAPAAGPSFDPGSSPD
ncbi:hypothetical protein [Pseudarthrobacter sp. H2]|uniref:hypothetical protein n=1 Tax=Pseudarthrobacter sp. H2 TaxID=3418415 RepID=UPI003CEDFB3C